MQTELKSLDKNNTWDIFPLPIGKKLMGCKWVYKIKLKSDNTFERYKARLVAKGYTNEHNIDYQEMFSLVVKMTTIRCVMTLVASKKWPLLFNWI